VPIISDSTTRQCATTVNYGSADQKLDELAPNQNVGEEFMRFSGEIFDR
jgi:hypothetical protein